MQPTTVEPPGAGRPWDSQPWTLLSNTYRLTGAQCRVALLLARGWRPAQVADWLGSSIHTVHSHTQEIYDKLNLHNQAQLVAWFAAGAPERWVRAQR